MTRIAAWSLAYSLSLGCQLIFSSVFFPQLAYKAACFITAFSYLLHSCGTCSFTPFSPNGPSSPDCLPFPFLSHVFYYPQFPPPVKSPPLMILFVLSWPNTHTRPHMHACTHACLHTSLGSTLEKKHAVFFFLSLVYFASSNNFECHWFSCRCLMTCLWPHKIPVCTCASVSVCVRVCVLSAFTLFALPLMDTEQAFIS